MCIRDSIVKGVRYIVKSKKWRDRGKGRGFGYVTSKLVRYRCGEVQSPESYSNPGEGWGQVIFLAYDNQFLLSSTNQENIGRVLISWTYQWKQLKWLIWTIFDTGQIRKLPSLIRLTALVIPKYFVYDQSTLCNYHVKSLTIIYWKGDNKLDRSLDNNYCSMIHHFTSSTCIAVLLCSQGRLQVFIDVLSPLVYRYSPSNTLSPPWIRGITTSIIILFIC